MKIKMKDILANANGIYATGVNAGEKVLECNLEKMKKWTEEEIDNAIDENGNLRRNDSDERVLLSNSRTRVLKALGNIIRKMKDEGTYTTGISAPKRRQFAKMLTSKENILSKFKKAEIEL